MDKHYDSINAEIGSNFLYDDSTLCHYTSPNALINILRNRTLRFTDYRFLNDKTEGTYICNVIDALDLTNYDDDFKKIVENSKNGKITVSEIRSNYLSHIVDDNRKRIGTSYNYFICSFSADHNNLALWNYYTKTLSGAGYNIVLYTEDLQKNISENLTNKIKKSCLFFKKVVYDKEQQKTIVKKILDYYYNAWKDSEAHELLEESLYKTIDELRMCFKNPYFALEGEVRMIAKIAYSEYKKALTTGEIEIIEKDGYFVPYIDLCFGETQNLGRVTISPKGETAFANQSVRILLDKYGYNDTEIVNSKIPLR